MSRSKKPSENPGRRPSLLASILSLVVEEHVSTLVLGVQTQFITRGTSFYLPHTSSDIREPASTWEDFPFGSYMKLQDRFPAVDK